MPIWEVTLKDQNRVETLIKRNIEAGTEYGAKRGFFDQLVKENPKLKMTPFSVILPFLKIRTPGDRRVRPSVVDYSAEDFFKSLPANSKNPTKELRTSSCLLDLAILITKQGLDSGYIPRICPICGRPVETLQIHHWKDPKYLAISKGDYRRICGSCNTLLGTIYLNKPYPKWELQLRGLRTYFITSSMLQLYENSSKEEWWSMLTQKEWETITTLWNMLPTNKP